MIFRHRVWQTVLCLFHVLIKASSYECLYGVGQLELQLFVLSADTHRFSDMHFIMVLLSSWKAASCLRPGQKCDLLSFAWWSVCALQSCVWNYMFVFFGGEFNFVLWVAFVDCMTFLFPPHKTGIARWSYLLFDPRKFCLQRKLLMGFHLNCIFFFLFILMKFYVSVCIN